MKTFKDLFSTVLFVAALIWCLALRNWPGALGFFSAAFYAFFYLRMGRLFDDMSAIAGKSLEREEFLRERLNEAYEINRQLLKEMNYDGQ